MSHNNQVTIDDVTDYYRSLFEPAVRHQVQTIEAGVARDLEFDFQRFDPTNSGYLLREDVEAYKQQEIQKIELNPAFAKSGKEWVESWFDFDKMDKNKQGKVYRKDVFRALRKSIPGFMRIVFLDKMKAEAGLL